MGRIARALLAFDREHERFARSLADFQEGPLRRRGQRIGESFVEGSHAALEVSRPEALAARLAGVERELSGFAYEGAGLGLALLDAFLPWQHRLSAFTRGAGAPQIYMLHVGAGWALARMPVSVARFQARL